jgi:hypothetical protein
MVETEGELSVTADGHLMTILAPIWVKAHVPS